ncbi:MAG TPA: hypothetical protein VGK43_06720, partial [Solirubrobacterales bacterium]
QVVRISTSGAVTLTLPIPTPNSGPQKITTGPDGNLWFTESLGNRIGRVILPGPASEIPTLSTWMMGIFALLLLAAGWVLIALRS